jgi:dihydrolipoamide dehydrogenase
VGKTEGELKAANIKYRIGRFPFLANSRARVNNDTEGFIKVISAKKGGRILGVHILGPDAGEMIHEAVVAMEFGATDDHIASLSHGHPSLSEAIMEACRDSAYGKPIHY